MQFAGGTVGEERENVGDASESVADKDTYTPMYVRCDHGKYHMMGYTPCR